MDVVANKNNSERPARPGNSLQRPIGSTAAPAGKFSRGRKTVLAIVAFVVVVALVAGGWLFYNKSQQ